MSTTTNTTDNEVIIKNVDEYIGDAYKNRSAKDNDFYNCFNDEIVDINALDTLIDEIYTNSEEIKNDVLCDGVKYLSGEFNRFISYRFSFNGYVITMDVKFRVEKRDIVRSYLDDKNSKRCEISLFIKDVKSGRWVAYVTYITYFRRFIDKNTNKLICHKNEKVTKIGEIEKRFYQHHIETKKYLYTKDKYGTDWMY